LRVFESVKIKMPHLQWLTLVHEFIAFDHCVCGAFDAALKPQRLQQVTRECGFAAAQVTSQAQHRIGQFRLCGELLGKRLT